MGYKASSILEMSEIDHIRANTGMYIGSSENPTRLLHEVLDNALDEVQVNCKKIHISIDTNNSIFTVSDWGRGFPFDQNLPLKKDPPVLSCSKLFTSGKFKKGEKNSAYQIASGLHGVGLVACYALSDHISIDIYRNGKHASYNLTDKSVNRSQEKFPTKDKPYSTSISVKPSKKYFENLSINVKDIEERLLIASSNFEDLDIILEVDGEEFHIKNNEDELIENTLSNTVDQWYIFENKNKGEYCKACFGWDEKPPISTKKLTIVNLVKVHEGFHINKILNIIQSNVLKIANKYKYEIEETDCSNNLRLYLNLQIIKTSFEAQVKVKLERKSDLSIMDFLEKDIKNVFNNNEDHIKSIIENMHNYRKSIQTKKIISTQPNRKRGLSNFTKLRDCTSPNGELFICEGDSAEGGLVQGRNPKKHAILPLKGVIPNCIKKKDVVNNKEIKDIIQCVGTGIGNSCNIKNIRYEKICISCDADPAGHFISSLLIVLFAKYMPDIIKNGKLYLCETPLFGIGYNDKFEPIWDESELKQLKKENKKVRRIKGLGEFNPSELKKFTFDESTRKLIKIEWDEKVDRVYDLLESVEEKRKLINGDWKV